MEVPEFDGTSAAFANYEDKVSIWKKVATLGPVRKAAHLLLHMSDLARKVCARAGKDLIGNMDGAGQVLEISRERLAPDAIDSISQDVLQALGPDYGLVPAGI